jgi:predicted flap endonuclease-1-like 5' DNA nuclease/cytoskeletal protein CcmA (bactofilin family)
MRITKLLQQNRSWLLTVVAVTALATLVVFAPPLQAAAPHAPDQPQVSQQQVFNDDLTVRSGDTFAGDVVVYQGDVTVERGGVIGGNLIVYSGDAKVEQEGRVEGDITAFSGDVEIDGAVGGSITAWSGDVDLRRSAVVGGDVSVVSGEIEQARGAVVEGSVLRGPAIPLDLPPLPELGALPGLPVPPIAPAPPTPFQLFWALLGRVLMGVLVLGVAALVAILLLKWRPELVESTRRTLVERTALAFAAGLIFNLFGLAIIGLLWITICFRPPALLLALLLAAINLAGAVVVGDELGRRLEARLGSRWPQPWRTVIGIGAPGAVIAFLWIIGSCFSFFAFLGTLILMAFGVGAILVKFLKLGEPGAPAPAPVTPKTTSAAAPAETAAAAAPPPVPTPVAPPAPVAPPVAEERVSAPPAIAPEPAAPPAEPLPAEDDFTLIAGIGPVFDQRLKAAGIRTFGELAARSTAEVAAIIQWSESRVERTQIIAQAHSLAGQAN